MNCFLTTISLVSWHNVVLIFLKSSLFEKMAAFSPVLIPAPSIHSMSMLKVWMNCLIRLLRKTKGCLKKKLIKPGKKWVLHYSNPQNNRDMNRIQLHKSIQHVTTTNGKLSDKTIKLINIMAKKAYGSK